MQPLSDLADAVAFERLALDAAGGVAPTTVSSGPVMGLDLRGGGSTINLTASGMIGGAAPALTQAVLRPLLFGAAWKILDLTVEYALANRAGSKVRTTWRIADKAKETRKGLPPAAPFDVLPTEWAAVGNLYHGTQEIRHSLVHRTVSIGPQGELGGADRNGNPLIPVSAQEQGAFCKTMQRVIDALLAQALGQRELDDLRYHLNLLVSCVVS